MHRERETLCVCMTCMFLKFFKGFVLPYHEQGYKVQNIGLLSGL